MSETLLQSKFDTHPLMIDLVLGRIFSYLRYQDFKNCRLVCSRWKEYLDPNFVSISLFTLTIAEDACEKKKLSRMLKARRGLAKPYKSFKIKYIPMSRFYESSKYIRQVVSNVLANFLVPENVTSLVLELDALAFSYYKFGGWDALAAKKAWIFLSLLEHFPNLEDLSVLIELSKEMWTHFGSYEDRIRINKWQLSRVMKLGVGCDEPYGYREPGRVPGQKFLEFLQNLMSSARNTKKVAIFHRKSDNDVCLVVPILVEIKSRLSVNHLALNLSIIHMETVMSLDTGSPLCRLEYPIKDLKLRLELNRPKHYRVLERVMQMYQYCLEKLDLTVEITKRSVELCSHWVQSVNFPRMERLEEISINYIGSDSRLRGLSFSQSAYDHFDFLRLKRILQGAQINECVLPSWRLFRVKFKPCKFTEKMVAANYVVGDMESRVRCENGSCTLTLTLSRRR